MPRTTTATATVLIVDDEPDVRAVLTEIVESRGYLADTAVDGAAALRRVIDLRPQLVLLDVDMPRLRGGEALVAIRELCPETNVIMISGKADLVEARRALSLGAFDYIGKPFDVAYLIQAIEAAAL
ncbi:MAG: response regulator [Candidatus Rokuibacteriota bacterium]